MRPTRSVAKRIVKIVFIVPVKPKQPQDSLRIGQNAADFNAKPLKLPAFDATGLSPVSFLTHFAGRERVGPLPADCPWNIHGRFAFLSTAGSGLRRGTTMRL